MKAIFFFTILLLFISRNCYGNLEVNNNELLLRSHGIMHTRRIRDTDNRQLVGHHVAQRRLDRREVIRKKPKNIFKDKKYKAIKY